MNIHNTLEQITDIAGMTLVQETLRKPAMVEADKYALQMNRIKAELIPFENRFGKDSRTAWDEFQSEKLGDDGDIMEWMKLFENYPALEKHHKRITEMQIKN